MDPPQCNALHSAGHYSATRKGTARRPQPSLTIPHIHTLSLSLSHVVFFRRCCSSLRERHSPPPSPSPTHPTLGPFPLPFLGKNLLLHGHRLIRKSRLLRIRQHRRMQLQRPVPILSFGPSRLQALERQRRGDSQRHRAHHLPHQANTPFHQVSKKSNEISLFHSGCWHDVVLVQEPCCPN